MADEPKKDQPEEIESILSDLDAILSDTGGDAMMAPAPAEPPKPIPPAANPVEAPKPVEMPKPVEAVKFVEVPKPVEMPKPVAPVKSVEIPMPVEIAKPAETTKPPSIELAPRDGIIKPPEKKPEPAKPAPKLPVQSGIELSAGPSIPMPPKPQAPPPSPVAADSSKAPPPPPVAADSPKAPPPPPSAPQAPQAVIDSPKANQPLAPKPAEAPKASPAVPAKPEDLPADAPKEQIRRVAYIYTPSCSTVKASFALFLSQAARTISKKPLFLREVLAHEVGAASDPNAVIQKSLQAKAAAILAVVEDWPPSKVDELSEACSRANLLFRAVAPADAQKKSTAVDIIVDMMLLPGEG